MTHAIAFFDESAETAIRIHPRTLRRPLRRTASTASRAEVALARISPAYAYADAPCVCQVPACAAIPLHGKQAIGDAAYALVDFADAAEMLKYRWAAYRGTRALTSYAVRRVNGKTVWMHRALLALPAFNNRTNDVDHINGNGLDNRRSNLRVCTRSQNQRNRRRAHSRCGYKGVNWDKVHGVWQAHIKLHGVKKTIGRFATAEAAAAAYDREVARLYEGFAQTNAAIGGPSGIYIDPQYTVRVGRAEGCTRQRGAAPARLFDG